MLVIRQCSRSCGDWRAHYLIGYHLIIFLQFLVYFLWSRSHPLDYFESNLPDLMIRVEMTSTPPFDSCGT